MAKKKDHREETALPNEPERSGSIPGTGDNSARAETAPEGAAPLAGQLAEAEPEERQRALEAEVADLKDRLLRKQADFENFRKRMLREREEAARYANAALLGDLLAVIDDFERAIRSAEEAKDFPLFLQGVGMIEHRMLEMLESRWGLKRFSAIGEVFDPVRHEAMQRAVAPAGASAQPTVVEEYQKGYYLHDRVLRPAKVKVLVPGEQAIGGTGGAPVTPPGANDGGRGGGRGNAQGGGASGPASMA